MAHQLHEAMCRQEEQQVRPLHTAGADDVHRHLPEAEELRQVMGAWESEWSLRHMLAVLRRATLNALIKPKSAEPTELLKLIEALKNYVNLAV